MPDPKSASKPNPHTEDWRDLAEQASRESDPQKLVKLVQDLCDRLDQWHAERKLKPRDKNIA